MTDQTILETIRDILRQRSHVLDDAEYLANRGNYDATRQRKQEAIDLMGNARELMARLYPNKSAEERKSMLEFAATLIHL